MSDDLTRTAFIRRYVFASAITKAEINGRGYTVGRHRRRALRCACGENMCEAWAMIPDDPEDIDWHMRTDHPMAETWEALSGRLVSPTPGSGAAAPDGIP